MTSLVRLGRGQSAYVRDEAVIVEWYDFGEDVAYEFATMLVFNRPDRHYLACALDLPPTSDPGEVIACIGERFNTFFEFRVFAKDHALPFTTETDFWP